MKKEEIIDFIKTHPVCHLATEEGGQPHVRGMAIYRVEERGIVFQTSDVKDLWGQIQKNGRVELCFNDFGKNMQLRVVGVAEEIDDDSLRQEVLKDRPFLKPLADARGLKAIKLFRVRGCKAHVWTMEKNLEPKEWVEIFP
jgi:uncharacterized pyridoxamine 5'-phosphate oxidase family protein